MVQIALTGNSKNDFEISSNVISYIKIKLNVFALPSTNIDFKRVIVVYGARSRIINDPVT